MVKFICFGRKLELAFKRSWSFKPPYLIRESKLGFVSSFRGSSLFRANSFFVQLPYFVFLSVIGYLSMKVLGYKTKENKPKDLDVFFMSVSAVTLSSMDTVEMEVFSISQNIILMLLMLLGGEVFTSCLELQFQYRSNNVFNNVVPHYTDDPKSSDLATNKIELGSVNSPPLENNFSMQQHRENYLKYNRSIKSLGHVVLAYLFMVHLLGSSFIYLYLTLISGAGEILKHKKFNPLIFSVFLTVSTFANCGFVPTNENMMIFSRYSGLLWLLIPLILMGNTLYAVCLRLTIWVLEKFSKKEELGYLLKNSKEMGYRHLVSGKKSLYLAGTVLAFLFIQLVMLCTMEWKSNQWNGLNGYQKFVASAFQVSNTRHSGELVVDLSQVSQSTLVLFVIMMYLPPYTSFMPIKDDDDEEEEEPVTPRKGFRTNRRNKLMEHLKLSQLSYLALFVILICITERKSLKEDPLNFTVLNIVIEVISAYGNVGFTTSYSCSRRLNHGKVCEDKWVGFVGHWSTGGKLILIVVMFFGRLKRFSRKGGAAWKLL